MPVERSKDNRRSAGCRVIFSTVHPANQIFMSICSKLRPLCAHFTTGFSVG
jgi:hypothetical protein